jgi:hypothetical protein
MERTESPAMKSNVPTARKGSRQISILALMALIATLSFAARSHNIQAAESWRAFGTSSNNVLFSVDETSLTRDGDTVQFLERLVYVNPERHDELSRKWVKEKRVQRVMNCAERTQGHLRGTLLADDGRLIESVSTEPAYVEMTAVPAGTVAADELAWACAARAGPTESPGR